MIFFSFCKIQYLFLVKSQTFSFENRQERKSASLVLNMDVSFCLDPGIYEILDIKNDKSYYGETDCLANRLSRHFNELKTGVHHCSKLLDSFNEQANPDGFKFIILESVPHFKDRALRLSVEEEYIKANAHRTYNFQDKENQVEKCSRQIKPIMYEGQRFKSIHEAVRILGKAKASIMRDLKNPQKLDVFLLEAEFEDYGQIPIFGQKGSGPSVFFEGYSECIQAGYASNRQNARRKIQRNEMGWRYVHTYADGKPIRTPYKLKEGEISYKEFQIKEKDFTN
jgi:hypothetical protein